MFDVPSASISADAIDSLVGRAPGEVALYEQALMHRSFFRGQPGSALQSNERLEFLGDAILGFWVAEHLYQQLPGSDEGELTRLRAKLVNKKALVRYAQQMELGAHVLMSENMAQTQGRQNATILADAFEALVGALYLDHGSDAVRAFIQRTVFDGINLDRLARRKENFKSLLLEHVQARGRPQPTYRIIREDGPPHDKTFTAEALLDGQSYGRGTAGSKQQAEQQAAGQALDRLQNEMSSEG